jgi:membrane associated rhomboid family serine protease
MNLQVLDYLGVGPLDRIANYKQRRCVLCGGGVAYTACIDGFIAGLLIIKLFDKSTTGRTLDKTVCKGVE